MVFGVYALCALTSLACAVLLFVAHRRTRVQLLLWSALCFCGLAANNVLLFADMWLALDIAVIRKLPALLGVLVLLHGLISDSK